MCFSIPKQIKQIKDNIAKLEDGRLVTLGDIKAKKGEYILVFGDMAVEKMPTEKALQARSVIKHIDELHSSSE